MYPIVKYTAVFKNNDDYMEVKHLESDEQLSELIGEIIEDYDLDPEDGYFKQELDDLILLFNGNHKPKSFEVEKVSKLKVKLEQ